MKFLGKLFSWAKSPLGDFLVSLTWGLLVRASKAATDYIERRKRIRAAQEAAREVEDAKTPEDIRDASDNLP